MSPILIITCSVVYVGLLFWIASFAEKRSREGRSLVNNPYIYALSLAVYCTAWTYYGSVGRAATSGIGFLPIYLGPTIMAPLWIIVLHKIVLISKAQRITSVADFISSRYGKSTWIGALASVLAVLAVIPYIAIQLKAINSSLFILTNHEYGSAKTTTELAFYNDPAMYIAVALAIFTILFGTRNLDPNERHEGLIAAIAFESIFKLTAFMSVGIFITFFLYNGFGDLFSHAMEVPEIRSLFDYSQTGVEGWNWFWLTLISMSAVFLLPRQFHVAVVENNRSTHLTKAAWLFPLYLFLINIFVIPIAVGGLLQFPDGQVDPDTFVLNVPFSEGKKMLALFAALGGFSAATSMVIVAVIALSIMVTNNLILPILVRTENMKDQLIADLSVRFLALRRISIIVVLILSYGYFRSISENYTLVSIGLISFTGIVQFAPIVLGGIYWKRATKVGAFSGLAVGLLVWAYTLPIPTLGEVGVISSDFIEHGLFGLEALKPYNLLGMNNLDHVSHSAFWSLFFNVGVFIVVSLNTRPGTIELAQADLFVDIYKYQDLKEEPDLFRRHAKVKDIEELLIRFLGERRGRFLLNYYSRQTKVDLQKSPRADARLVNFAEKHLSGAIGAAAAKIILNSVVSADPINLEEMLRILEQTQEVMEYNRELEQKSLELQRMTEQLQKANEQLKELDQLKADFITTVTHELRTPITSIKALAKILQDEQGLDLEKRAEFLGIMVQESERIARLINQVLDLEKIQSGVSAQWTMEKLDLVPLCRTTIQSVERLIKEHNIQYHLELPQEPVWVNGNNDKIKQVVVNLLSNAIKFCRSKIQLRLETTATQAILIVEDDGIGIGAEDQKHIFGQFVQVSNVERGKPQGSGLGLFICQRIVQQHQGKIWVESQLGAGARFKVQLPILKP